MRLVLPHLHSTGPATILDQLRDTGGQFLGDDSQGRTVSLAGSIAYSYQHLSTDEQRMLVVLGLLHGVGDTAVLALLSAVATVPERFLHRRATDWVALLDRATDLGLVTALGTSMYAVHPALPSYLAARWHHEEPDYPDQRAATASALVDAYAAFAGWLDRQITGGDAGLGLTVIRTQRHTLGAMLGYALQAGRYGPAAAIALVLTRFWDTAGMDQEARGWTDRIQLATETAGGTPPSLDTPAGQL